VIHSIGDVLATVFDQSGRLLCDTKIDVHIVNECGSVEGNLCTLGPAILPQLLAYLVSSQLKEVVEFRPSRIFGYIIGNYGKLLELREDVEQEGKYHFTGEE